MTERTVVLIKPDGFEKHIIGKVIDRFETAGLHLVALKMVQLTQPILDVWYAHHKDKPFFPGLKSYMKSYPVIAMLWEGIDVVSTVRTMIGITKAREATPGTIRGDFAMSQQYNLIHASENLEAAEREQSIIFSENEIFDWQKIDEVHVYLEEEKKK